MTDGRIPGKWMSEPRFAEMSVDTWCVLTKAITWSNEAGTDGLIKRRYLGQFHPDGDRPGAYAELVELGLWAAVPSGYQFVDWAKKAHHGGLGQSTAAEVQTQKERNRRTSQAYRDRQRGIGDSADVTDHGDRSRRTGHDRTRNALEDVHSETKDQEVDEVTGEVRGSMVTAWATAVPGGAEAGVSSDTPVEHVELSPGRWAERGAA